MEDVTLDDLLSLTRKLDNRLMYVIALIEDDRKQDALELLKEMTRS